MTKAQQNFLFILILVTAGFSTSLLYVNCSPVAGSESSVTEQQAADVEFYFHRMSHLHLDVVFEPGAEPYTGTTASGLNYWDLLEDNLKALFQGRPVTLRVPKSISQMRPIPSLNRNSWTPTQVLALARQYRDGDNDSTTGRFFIAFVKGYAAEGAGTNPNILGYAISGSNVMVIFKDVIRSTGTHPNGAVPKYVEQSTLVHEMSHALGLVNHGLPLTTAHQDTANGHHCNNPNCVMYYLNEGKSDMVQFVQQLLTTGSTVMLDQQCLQDARSF